jgi:hypothetical protein
MNSIFASNATVARLAARADLTFATADLCNAYRGMLLRRWEADDRGDAMDIQARTQMVLDHYIDQTRAFIAAWQKGASAVENMRVIETAVQGYSEQFNVDDQTKAAVGRMLLDFMRGAVWRLPAPGSAAAADGDPVDVALIDLERRLETLRVASRAEGSVLPPHHGPATTAALSGVQKALDSAVRAGVERRRMQIALEWWAKATGNTVTFNVEPSTHPSKE